jgi:O-antigen ligase
MDDRIIKRLLRRLQGINVIEILFLLQFCVFYGHRLAAVRIADMDFNIAYFLQILLFIAAAFYIVSDAMKKKFGKNDIKRLAFPLWYAGFTGFGLLSLIWIMENTEPMMWIESMLRVLVVLIAAAYYINSEERFIRFTKIQIIAGCYAALRVLVLLPERRLFGRGHTSLFITDIAGFHYNAFCAILALVLMLNVFLYLRTKKLFVLLPACLIYFVILFAGARQGVLTPLAGVFFIVVLYGGIKHIRRTIIITGVSAVSFALYLLAGLPGSDVMLGLIGSVFDRTADGSASERRLLIETAGTMFLEKPFLGYGLGSFAFYFGELTGRPPGLTSHNNYMELLSGLGIIGFAFYYSMYTYVIVKAIRFIKAGLKNIYTMFALTVCFTLLFIEIATVVFHPHIGMTGALFLFCAFYALKLAGGEKNAES